MGSSSYLIGLGKRAKIASERLSRLEGAQRKRGLLLAAEYLEKLEHEVLPANALDLQRAGESGLSPTQIDRLQLNPARFASMVAGIREVAALKDVVGEVSSGYRLENGLSVQKVRVPLGIVAIIYENRPNVTSDAAALCIKSGNVAFLRGSSQAINSNRAIADVLRRGLAESDVPADALLLVEETSREGAVEFMQLDGYIDCLIPRGGRSLIESVREHATVPSVIDGDGNCHIYVDASADLEVASSIIRNAKVQRPGVCNAVESLLVHASVAESLLPMLDDGLPEVELRGDPATRRLIARAVDATEEDYATEFLDLILAVRVVDSLDDAIEHIARYSSGHSEAIITTDVPSAQRFTREVDAAAVLVNASTRFVDGGQLGLGAEIGISTQKLHARGPMGLEALTTLKFVIEGNGQIRA